MKSMLRVLLLFFGVFYCVPASAATLPFSVQALGSNIFRIRYDLSSIDFLKNQELAVDFDPAVYDTLANATKPPDFDVLLFQPNDPLGTVGRLSALALVNHPALAGQFLSVDIKTFAAAPGAQSFTINELDERGMIRATIATGVTAPIIANDPLPSPEPSAFAVLAISMFIACASPAWRRRLNKTR